MPRHEAKKLWSMRLCKSVPCTCILHVFYMWPVQKSCKLQGAFDKNLELLKDDDILACVET